MVRLVRRMATPLEKMNRFYQEWKNVEQNNLSVKIYDKTLTL